MKRIMIVTAVGISLFALTDIAGAQNAAEKERYIITVHPGNAPAEVANSHGVSARHVYTHVLNGFAGEIPPGRLVALAHDPRVSSISIDHQVVAFAKPGGGTKPPPTPPGETIPAGVVRIQAGLVTQTGAGVGVAILDTGLDSNHQDLRISGNSLVSPGFTYTSMAAPHVAGVVALLLGKSPSLTPGEVKTQIKLGDKVGSAPLNSPTSGYTFDGVREGVVYVPEVLK